LEGKAKIVEHKRPKLGRLKSEGRIMVITDLIYEGKAKRIYTDPTGSESVLLEFKNSLTALNGLKKGSFETKGAVNRDIASLIFKHLEAHGVESHFLEDSGEISMRVKKVKILPLEVVVRNVLAGSTPKKLGLPEGKELSRPLVEFYYKDDALQDPFVSDDQILMMNVASQAQIEELKFKALKINSLLQKLFSKANIRLIDFKVEFGVDSAGKIILADEITPDCCRLWDQGTQEKLDKDRFRRDLGQIKESYEEVLKRLKAVVAQNVGRTV
jgi:phosphoribosylaminoimidazole-succinocarboxamide synthase